jgi:hypothetical protein
MRYDAESGLWMEHQNTRIYRPQSPYFFLGAARLASRGHAVGGGGGGAGIAFVAANEGMVTGTSLGFALDVGTGADRCLLVGVQVSSAGTLSATYDGASMTLLESGSWFFGGGRYAAFRLVAPATGSHDVVVSSTVSGALRAAASTYTGVDQTTPEDATPADAAGNSSGRSMGLTTVTDDAWLVVMAGCQSSRDIAAGTGATLRSASGQDYAAMDSGALGSAGAHAISYALTGGSGEENGVVTALRPA